MPQTVSLETAIRTLVVAEKETKALLQKNLNMLHDLEVYAYLRSAERRLLATPAL